MTAEEAHAVLVAASQPDGGCGYCIADVIERLVKLLPDVDWLAAVAPDDDPAYHPYAGGSTVRQLVLDRVSTTHRDNEGGAEA